MNIARAFAVLLLLSILIGVLTMGNAVEPRPGAPDRRQFQKMFEDGNYKEALEGFRKLALDPKDDPRQVGQDLQMAVQCLQQLNRVDEVDALIESAIEVHKQNWRLLWAAACQYMELPHHGFMIAGKFHRGDQRGGGEVVNANERDRVRALQLMVQALPPAKQDANHAEVGEFLLGLANMLLNNRDFEESWRLQYLTDLGQLPDYEEGWGSWREIPGAPVDENGKPVYHQVPKSFETAQTDGQRWRWALEQAVEFNPQQADEVKLHFADFLWNQFDVQTMADYGWAFGRMATDDTKQDESGTYALHTLGENETIARLTTGIKRFELPDEFNFIKLYQQVADKPQSGWRIRALGQLAEIFENRRQYPRAAEFWRRLVEMAPEDDGHKHRLQQIVGNWGRFEPVMGQPASDKATVEYRFRNGKSVQFTAHAIKAQLLLDDVKAYVKSRPQELDWDMLNLENIGYRIVEQNQQKYLGEQVAAWKLDLEPREKHFDKRVTVETPLT
ncbi:MAG: alpha-2-macroglobulin, partial [Pirellulales bacterium]|nr:alpha-2-macroglobulin [Pirellulales bacterium]